MTKQRRAGAPYVFHFHCIKQKKSVCVRLVFNTVRAHKRTFSAFLNKSISFNLFKYLAIHACISRHLHFISFIYSYMGSLLMQASSCFTVQAYDM